MFHTLVRVGSKLEVGRSRQAEGCLDAGHTAPSSPAEAAQGVSHLTDHFKRCFSERQNGEYCSDKLVNTSFKAIPFFHAFSTFFTLKPLEVPALMCF